MTKKIQLLNKLSAKIVSSKNHCPATEIFESTSYETFIVQKLQGVKSMTVIGFTIMENVDEYSLIDNNNIRIESL